MKVIEEFYYRPMDELLVAEAEAAAHVLSNSYLAAIHDMNQDTIEALHNAASAVADSQRHDIFRGHMGHTKHFAGQELALDLFLATRHFLDENKDQELYAKLFRECGDALVEVMQTGEDSEANYEDVEAGVTRLGVEALYKLWTEAKFVADTPMDTPLRYQVYSAPSPINGMVPAHGGYIMARHPNGSNVRVGESRNENRQVEFDLNVDLPLKIGRAGSRIIRIVSVSDGQQPTSRQGSIFDRKNKFCMEVFEPRTRHLEMAAEVIQDVIDHSVEWQEDYRKANNLPRF
jgi:hypothetical protein